MNRIKEWRNYSPLNLFFNFNNYIHNLHHAIHKLNNAIHKLHHAIHKLHHAIARFPAQADCDRYSVKVRSVHHFAGFHDTQQLLRGSPKQII